MTVRELLSRMDSREFSEWIAYYGILGEGDEPPEAPQQTPEMVAALLRQAQRQMEKQTQGKS